MADATATRRATPQTRAAAARRPRAPAAAKTRARSTSTRPATRAERAQQLAERVVLIPVGAALEARDRVGELVTTTSSRRALERQLRRFERRGGSARTHARKNLGTNVESLTSRVEKVVQDGVDAGMRLVNGAQDRLSKVV